MGGRYGALDLASENGRATDHWVRWLGTAISGREVTFSFEPLEKRCMLAFSIHTTLDNQVVFAGDDADDSLILRQLPDGFLQYTLLQSGTVTTSLDLHSGLPGEQRLQVSEITSLTVDANGGNDAVSISSRPFQLTSGSLSIVAETVLVDADRVQTSQRQTFRGNLVLTADVTFVTDVPTSMRGIPSSRATRLGLMLWRYPLIAQPAKLVTRALGRIGDLDGAGTDHRGVAAVAGPSALVGARRGVSYSMAIHLAVR